METFQLYFLQASTGIVLFYLLYLLLLKNETYYTTNRFFLIVGLILALVLPLFPITYESPIALMQNAEFFTLTGNSPLAEIANAGNIQEQDGSAIYFTQLILWFYIAVMAFFLMRLLWQTVRISWKIRHSTLELIDGIKVINQKNTMPYSFFNVVFIDIQEYSESELSNIITHEKVHILERHWIDLLIIELMTVLFWVNPVVWLYERSIKQNHEYLADQGVLLAGYSPGQYQALLINQLMGVKVLGFAHNLNFSLNKKRMEMMKKEKSPGASKMKLLLVLPVIALLILAFAKKDYVAVDATQQSVGADNSNISMHKNELVDLIKVKGKIVDSDGNPMTGANVILKGTSTGTVVDEQGVFELEAPQIDKPLTGTTHENGDSKIENANTIVVSFIGYETIWITFNSQTDSEFNSIKMKEGVFNIKLPDVNEPNFKMQLPPPPPPKNYDDWEGDIYVVIEQMPYYNNGGMSRLALDINKEVKLVLDKTKDRGEAVVGFTIAANGKIVNPYIAKSANSKMLDESAVKIIAKLDNWWAGMQRSKRVPVDLTVPVKFE